MGRVMTAIAEPEHSENAAAETKTAFRVQAIMRQGTASSIEETWNRYTTVAEAREAVKGMYHDDRVLRAFIVVDSEPPRFVEWVER